ncbi:hypothetical protein BDN72DRAFT_781567 [Pluteus cervinus]|uniref:Uncharacterized protein n=1 Tax=Pluteus cervinus TaxID=181527 RepID=A0ACD2ZYZ2_9AGAR|nr:hypothetical protein BDN72DRAFT_781567 [Pluteus cervinus]
MAATTKWKVAVPAAADVLTILRLNSQCTDYEIARFLLVNGIPFHTLRLTYAPALRQSRNIALEWRSMAYTFTVDDYHAYHSRLVSFLTTSRGRAALLEGGIVWRIAKDIVSFSDALQGPCDPMDSGRSLIYDHPSIPDARYFDDRLSLAEIDLICGVYECRSCETANQTVRKSWWPLPDTYRGKACGMMWGRWTPQNEEHYRKRLSQILDGKAVPLSSTGWRSPLRGRSTGRGLYQAYGSHAKEFLAARNIGTIA